MKQNIKGAFCPQCHEKLFRIKVKRDRPVICNYCGFKIENPKEVLIPKSKYLELKDRKN